MVSPILPERPDQLLPAGLEHLAPTDEAARLSERLCAAIRAEIARDDFISFARFMEHALYAPGMGYYAGGSVKLGASGDYVTAPEVSPLFGRALAAQVAELLGRGFVQVLELGAGTGRLACDLLHALAEQGATIERYAILEVSPELRARQRRTLERLAPAAVGRVEWLDTLPRTFSGIVIGNEVLDALPVHLLHGDSGSTLELGVGVDPGSGAFSWRTRPVSGELAAIAAEIDLPDGYTTEVHLAACGLVRSLADRLERGAALFLDYGFPRREYYHPERRAGTLMCHYRHRAHCDPFVLIGLQDITAHLDFTALAEAAVAGGLDLLGYTNQTHFLVNCGILDLLQAIGPEDAASYAPAVAQAQQLLSPAEMGELFKAIAFGRGVVPPLLGFRAGDRKGTL